MLLIFGISSRLHLIYNKYIYFVNINHQNIQWLQCHLSYIYGVHQLLIFDCSAEVKTLYGTIIQYIIEVVVSSDVVLHNDTRVYNHRTEKAPSVSLAFPRVQLNRRPLPENIPLPPPPVSYI